MSAGPLLPAASWPDRAAFESWWREKLIMAWAIVAALLAEAACIAALAVPRWVE